MARRRQEGNFFFRLDVDFFSDRKIKILKARYGADGITLYIYLLCEIYKAGYYLKIDEDFEFIVSDDLNMDSNKVKQVLNFLLERSLFDNTLFQSDKVLTSAGIQRRYQAMVKARALKTPITVERFWLLPEEETETFIKVHPSLNNSRKNDDNSRKNDDNSRKNNTKGKERKGEYIDTAPPGTYFEDPSLNEACEYGTKCSGAEQKIRSTATTYADYLNMRQSLGYDLNNTIYQHPRNLEEAHDEMVRESHKEEIDKRLNEVAIRFPDIQSRYRELRKKYFYEDDEYLIRPARSAEEIVMEGRTLHHCVGGDTYLGRHDRGESYILMLRDKKQPERPYITVEIDSRKSSIRQWYGAHDRKPDQKNMQRWLDQYLRQLEEQPTAMRTRTA